MSLGTMDMADGKVRLKVRSVNAGCDWPPALTLTALALVVPFRVMTC